MTGDEFTKLVSIMESFNASLQELKSEVQDIRARVGRIELTQENRIIPRLNTIEECYTSTYERYAEGAGQLDNLQRDVEILKLAVLRGRAG